MSKYLLAPPFRRDAIPLWINILSGLIVLILSFQSISAYFAPSLAYGAFDLGSVANQQVMTTLGGRNVVMLVATLYALRAQNASLLAVTFVMHFAREAQDMIIVPYYAGFLTPAGLGQFVTFVVVFTIPELLALLRLQRIANDAASAAPPTTA
jgi:hypothetical protein